MTKAFTYEMSYLFGRNFVKSEIEYLPFFIKGVEGIQILTKNIYRFVRNVSSFHGMDCVIQSTIYNDDISHRLILLLWRSK